jgi:hypothetical protein
LLLPSGEVTEQDDAFPGEDSMPDERFDTGCQGHDLQGILFGYLQASPFAWWPGADGLTLQDALVCYWQAAAAGWVPNRGELCRRHPELADKLTTMNPKL